MKFLKSLVITSSVSLLALVAPASADVISYNASLTGPGFYNGSTLYNAANTGFTISTEGGLELGLGIVNRTIAQVAPDGVNSSLYLPPTTGGQTWGVNFSINANADGNGGVVGDYSYLLTVFQNSTGNTYTFDPLNIDDNTYYDATGAHHGATTCTPTNPGDPAGAQACNDDAFADKFGVQNSEYLAFPDFLGANFDLNDVYQITLEAYEPGPQGALVAADSITVNTPEPGTIALMLGSLGALGLVSRRRRKA
jgi:hypothetical protein